jgi:hypothetical protein
MAINSNAAVSMPETIPLGVSSSPPKTSKMAPEEEKNQLSNRTCKAYPKDLDGSLATATVLTGVQQLENQYKARTPTCLSEHSQKLAMTCKSAASLHRQATIQTLL